MAVLKRIGAAGLTGAALAVAAWFMFSSLFAEPVVNEVWEALDILQLAALMVGIAFNYEWKRRAGRNPGDGVTRAYLESNALFYANAALLLMFLHGWITLLATGVLAEDDHQAWVVWDAVNILGPIALGVTGCRLWREAGAGG